MENSSPTRQYLPVILWALVLFAIYFTFNSLAAQYMDGITMSWAIFFERLREIGGFLLAILAGLGLIEIYFYQLFYRQPSNQTNKYIIRGIQGLLGLFVLQAIVAFFELTDLIRMGEGPIAEFFRFPMTAMSGLQNALVAARIASKSSAAGIAGVIIVLALLAVFALLQKLSQPRNSRLGLAYLLLLPAFIGVLFLIIYPFIFQIQLAFSNASLGTQATKNAQYGLIYGWENLVTLFTGNVAKDAKFFEVFWRTIVWTTINVTFHVAGGMGLALLLNRPMKLQGFYRTLLIVPWAIPTTIAAMALRNEFDSRYGLFNILLGNMKSWLTGVAESTSSVALLGPTFDWLANTIGPVAWRQDPFWAFVSVLMSNIWLGIPFMAVIILGGLQSISREYYEAAEIDGASAWQQFRAITLPLLSPVLTPAIILGVVWTFNKFDIIYLITQGGPQEKTDILVSSMYKAAFQFYRYGFTAMFSLVIFVILFLFTLFYLRVSGGLKSAAE